LPFGLRPGTSSAALALDAGLQAQLVQSRLAEKRSGYATARAGVFFSILLGNVLKYTPVGKQASFWRKTSLFGLWNLDSTRLKS
jgi:hypothetical protein